MKISVRKYLIQNHPEEYKRILESTKREAEKMFALYPKSEKVHVPYFVPLSVGFDPPIMAYITYDRELNETT